VENPPPRERHGDVEVSYSFEKGKTVNTDLASSVGTNDPQKFPQASPKHPKPGPAGAARQVHEAPRFTEEPGPHGKGTAQRAASALPRPAETQPDHNTSGLGENRAVEIETEATPNYVKQGPAEETRPQDSPKSAPREMAQSEPNNTPQPQGVFERLAEPEKHGPQPALASGSWPRESTALEAGTGERGAGESDTGDSRKEVFGPAGRGRTGEKLAPGGADLPERAFGLRIEASRHAGNDDLLIQHVVYELDKEATSSPDSRPRLPLRPLHPNLLEALMDEPEGKQRGAAPSVDAPEGEPVQQYIAARARLADLPAKSDGMASELAQPQLGVRPGGPTVTQTTFGTRESLPQSPARPKFLRPSATSPSRARA